MSDDPYVGSQAAGFPPGADLSQAAGFPPSAGIDALRSPQVWTPGDALGAGWSAVRANPSTLVLGPFAAVLLAEVPAGARALLFATHVVERGSASYTAVEFGSAVAGFALGVFFNAGMTKIYVAAARGQRPRFGDVFQGGAHFWPLLWATLLMGFAIFGGFLALIVPGIIVAAGLCLTQFYAVDAGLGPFGALQASWRATTGHKGSLFVLMAAITGVMVLGVAACGIGYFVALPVAMTALATVYVRLSGKAPSGS